MSINLGSTAIADAKLGASQVDKIYLGSTEVWSKAAPSIRALKFTSADAQTLGIDTTKLGSVLTPYFEYSLDNGSTWSVWDITTTISFGNGIDLYLRGTNQRLGYGSNTLSNYTNFVFSTSSPVYCSGNVMHLLDFTQDLDTFPLTGGVGRLFSGCTQLVTAPALPATTLKKICYSGMFYGCTSLVTAPDLPATDGTRSCYESMFNGCSSLVNPPRMSMSTMSDNLVCTQMFRNCTSLTTPPALPTTTLSDSCYANMFYGCTNLESIPALPATTLGRYCYQSMFQGCSKIKISETQVGEYTNVFTFGVAPTTAQSPNMFTSTGGTFTGAPTAQTYYTSNTIIS